MKRIFKSIFIGALLIFCSSTAFAQQKFGYVNRMEIMSTLVEKEGVSGKIQKLEEQYIQQIEAVQVEYNNKVEDLQKNINTYSEGVKQMKNKELNDLRTRAQELQQMGQEELETTYQSLITPITEKLGNAIKKVGTDGGYTAVFDISSELLPYYNDKAMTDVTTNIKRELGI